MITFGTRFVKYTDNKINLYIACNYIKYIKNNTSVMAIIINIEITQVKLKRAILDIQCENIYNTLFKHINFREGFFYSVWYVSYKC